MTSIIAIEASSPELEGSQKDLNFFDKAAGSLPWCCRKSLGIVRLDRMKIFRTWEILNFQSIHPNDFSNIRNDWHGKLITFRVRN